MPPEPEIGKLSARCPKLKIRWSETDIHKIPAARRTLRRYMQSEMRRPAGRRQLSGAVPFLTAFSPWTSSCPSAAQDGPTSGEPPNGSLPDDRAVLRTVPRKLAGS